MGFRTAIPTVFSKFLTFTGRATRSEFWWWQLFVFVVAFILIFIEGIAPTLGFLDSIFAFVVFLPGLAVSVRRLHDIGRSGWWVLIAGIPILGLIVLIVFWVTPTKETGVPENYL